ncbi:MAG: nucleotidyltransferase domain-containing protein, partial [Thermoplasmata archaeon]|nr:nucleotidyltransferase domain-containing protein [Thermoplasmata archaeon]
MITLNRLFSTRERLKILSVILYKKDDISITDVSREARVSKGLVSNFFKILLKEKILRRKGRKFRVGDAPK